MSLRTFQFKEQNINIISYHNRIASPDKIKDMTVKIDLKIGQDHITNKY